MNSTKHATLGFSLVELMIALVAGMIVSGAAIAFLLSSLKSNGEYVQSTRLTQELRNSIDLISRDLRRAGYNDNYTVFLTPGAASPFSPIFVKDSGATGAGNEDADGCILYAYDSNVGRGVLNVASGEVRGVRRVAATMPDGSVVGVIEYAKSSGTAKPNCATEATPTYSSYPPACHSLWCPLSDPSKLNVTEFKVFDSTTTIGVNPDAIRVRELGLSLAGQLVGTTDFTRGQFSTVRIRADCLKNVIADCNASP